VASVQGYNDFGWHHGDDIVIPISFLNIVSVLHSAFFMVQSKINFVWILLVIYTCPRRFYVLFIKTCWIWQGMKRWWRCGGNFYSSPPLSVNSFLGETLLGQ
jgi:hypothetical protein